MKRPWALVTLSLLLFAAGLAAALDRKALVPLLIVVSVPLVGLGGLGTLRATFRPSPLIVGAAVLILWAAISNLWGYSTHFFDLTRIVATIALGIFAAGTIAALPEEAARHLDRWIIAGSVFLVAFLFEELLSDAWISSLFHPGPKFQAVGGHYRHVFDVAGGGAVLLAPTCFAVAALIHLRTRSLFPPLIYVALALLASALMPMAAAPLAVVLGSGAFVAAYFFRRLTFGAIFTALAAYLLLAPMTSVMIAPVGNLPMPEISNSQFSEQDMASRQERLAIWRYVAEQIADAPVFGHGFDAARDYSDRNATLPGTNTTAIPVHPHNGVLQVWLELGGVGIFIVSGLLAAAWRATRVLWDRPLAAAVVASTLVAASIPILVSFSLWNTWWLATLGFSAMFATRAVKAASAPATT